MNVSELEATARAIVAPGKGILAADESTGTIKKRFDKIGVESTEENRRAYRDLLFTTEGVEEFISGVILFDETIRQSTSDGVPFPKVLADKGIIPGIKVDKGAKPLALAAEGETVTEGLDGLRERLAEYRELGARFAKWRATYSVGPALPSRYCVDVNAHALEEQRLVERVEHGRRDVERTLDRVVAVHEDLGLHDRDDAGLLAECRVAGECVSIGLQAVTAGDSVADRNDRSPLGKPSAELRVLG